VSPAGSPKGSFKRSASEEHHTTKAIDTVTLSAISNQVCSCGSKEKITKDSISKSSSPDDELFQHAPTSHCPKTSDRELVFFFSRFFLVFLQN
jgi:hypothetical protein